MAKDNPNEGTPFNMAMLYYIELHKLRSNIDIFYTSQNYPACYRQLRLLFSKISKKLHTKEKTYVSKIFLGIKGDLSVNMSGSLGQRWIELSVLNADEKIIEVYTKLNDLMFKYKMIFPKIEVTGGLASLDKKYNLGGDFSGKS